MSALRTIVILGGGTSGWLAAAVLSHHLKGSNTQLRLIEAEDVSTIGIGESTVPPFVGLIKSLGINEQEFIAATNASYKLGIEFLDWGNKQQRYFHPFGVIGSRIENQDFYQCWLKARQTGHAAALENYSPCQVMAQNGRFWLPSHAQNTPIGGANYALHVDATLAAQYLKKFACARGLQHSFGKVQQVNRSANGFISDLILHNGEQIAGDFFIDCSGFNSVLTANALGVEFNDWSQYLPCDRAIVTRTTTTGPTAPYTQARAREAGWSWRIPLQNRVGRGYVYSSQFCSDTQARATLLKHVDAPLIDEPRLLQFTTGHRCEFWRHNCLALGLAGGFIEPLEATAIHLIARGIDAFLQFLPDRHCHPSLSKHYNRRMIQDYEEVRDFILLHYVTSQRLDTAFWRHCQTLPVPNSLQERIELFLAQGLIPEQHEQLFRSSSWQSVFEGMGIKPQHYSPRVDSLDAQVLTQNLAKAEAAILAMVKTLPSHDEFLRRKNG